MPFASGHDLLHYRLIDQIGAGGMGVVWRALDTTLDREVAIKILPEVFAGDPERLARFEREAKLLASLNHPNIAAVYGLHRTGDGVRFIAMELVAGEDLSERLERGPLPVADALAIASQIAEGLSAAHEAGVIHRDLKPANIKLTGERTVKVLDFGLAKALDPAASTSGADPSHSPTMTSAGTMAGVILGTAAYMSPEQARGRATDRRTDIWALGAVLFEMLAGRAPFPGEVISEIIAKILERDPPWDELPAPIHPGIRRLLERCLAKDPDERLRDAADIRLELRELSTDPTGQAINSSVADAPAARTASWARWLPWALLVATLLGLVASPLLRRAPVLSPERVVRFEINPPTGFQFGEFSASPDGSAVAFVASNREARRTLWVRRFDSTEHRQLPGTEGAHFPFWSPDMRSVAFFAQGKLRRIDLASDSIQTIADAPNGRGGAWGHDGTIIFTPEGSEVLYSVPSSGGTPRALTEFREPEATHRFPHFVGPTRQFVFCAHDRDSSHTVRRYLGELGSDRLVPLIEGMSEMYTPPGHGLFVREETLFVQPLDADEGRLLREPFPLASDIDDTFPRTGRAAYSVSDNGVLMYLQRRRVDSRIDAYDRGGRRLATVVPGGNFESPVLSSDGRRVLFTRPASQETSVWQMEIARGSATRVTSHPVSSINLAWSFDDRTVIYGAEGQIFRLDLDGGDAELLLDADRQELETTPIAIQTLDASSDGTVLAFSAWDPVSDFDLWLLPLDGSGVARRLSVAPGVQQDPVISPDGAWIAYNSDESGRYEVYVRKPGSGDAKWSVSTDGGATPFWSDDGRQLYYISADYELMTVSIGPSTTSLSAGLPERLFEAPRSVEDDGDIFFRQPRLVGIDDGRFLFQVPDEEMRDRTIEVVLNWERLLD